MQIHASLNMNVTTQNKFQDVTFQDHHCETALASLNPPSYHLLVREEVPFVNLFTNYVVREKETESPLGVNVINQFTAEVGQVLTR